MIKSKNSLELELSVIASNQLMHFEFSSFQNNLNFVSKMKEIKVDDFSLKLTEKNASISLWMLSNFSLMLKEMLKMLSVHNRDISLMIFLALSNVGQFSKFMIHRSPSWHAFDKIWLISKDDETRFIVILLMLKLQEITGGGGGWTKAVLKIKQNIIHKVRFVR